MQLSEKVVNSLDLKSATEFCLGSPLDRTPALISDVCLNESKDVLERWTSASLKSGFSIPGEVLTMPKSKLGHRPVLVSSLPARIAYQAMVAKISGELEPSSRGSEEYKLHQSFAEKSSTEYVVEIDIAGCYEFIDHERLRQEIVARSLNTEIANGIHQYLSECLPNRRGLPQLTPASDTLADLYLSVIQRRLMRKGLAVSRYADDFRVQAADWESSIETIELAAEFARDLGLIISDDKTKPIRTSEFKQRVTSRQEFEERYFDEAKDRLTVTYLTAGDYGEDLLVKIAPSNTRALISSMKRIISEWVDASRDSREPGHEHAPEVFLRRMIPLAIRLLRNDKLRISNTVFLDLLLKEPIRLERVCEYIIARASLKTENADSWNLVNRVVSTGRLSPWGKLWILHTAAQLEESPCRDFHSTMEWIRRQTSDRHETVRVQAAWALAAFQKLDESEAQAMLRDASPITQTGLAAALGKQGGFNASLARSVKEENRLIRAAYEWGESQ